MNNLFKIIISLVHYFTTSCFNSSHYIFQSFFGIFELLLHSRHFPAFVIHILVALTVGLACAT